MLSLVFAQNIALTCVKLSSLADGFDFKTFLFSFKRTHLPTERIGHQFTRVFPKTTGIKLVKILKS